MNAPLPSTPPPPPSLSKKIDASGKKCRDTYKHIETTRRKVIVLTDKETFELNFQEMTGPVPR
jgi:hypothetical protein